MPQRCKRPLVTPSTAKAAEMGITLQFNAVRPARLAAGWALILAFALPASAASQDVYPDFEARVAAEVHTGEIHQIRLSRDGQRLVSIGHDKFLLVWRAADLRLMRRVVLPSGRGHAGVLRAVALTPDGQRAFVGGVASSDPQAEGEVYELDLLRGELLSRTRLPASVETLDIDASGQRLAVGLYRGGVQVLDTKTRARRFADEAYDSTVKFLHFAPDGRLASTANDGMVRVYDLEGKLTLSHRFVETQASGLCQARSMGGGRFSPDGRYLAFGYQDCPQTVVLDFQAPKLNDLPKAIYLPKGEASPDSLCCISWSPDGQRLYTYGSQSPGRQAMLYVSRATDGFQAIQSLKVQARSFSNSIPLADGGLFVATQDPGILRLRADGTVAQSVRNQSTQTDFAQGQLLTNNTGELVAWPDTHGAWLSFDVTRPPSMGFMASGEKPGMTSVTGIEQMLGLRFERLRWGTHAQTLSVNGMPLNLGDGERVQAHAVHPTGNSYYLGGVWRIVRAAPSGVKLAEAATTSPVQHLTVSGDGRWLIAMLGDGTLRWYDALSLGEPVLSLYAEPERGEWVAWTPQGYYTASSHGDDYLGWYVQGEAGASRRFLLASQFLNELYRPDLMAKVLASKALVHKSTANAGQRLSELAAPRVDLSVSPGSSGPAKVKVEAHATGRPLNSLTLFVDDVPVLQADLGGVQSLQRSLDLPVGFAADSVRAEVSTDNSLGFDEWLPTQPQTLKERTPRGRLFVVALGVNDFSACRQTPECRFRALPNAPHDAEELSRSLVNQSKGLFRGVPHVQLLTPGSATPPTKAQFLAALGRLKEVQPQDTVVVFVAAHGIEAKSGRRYWFANEDANMQDIDAILAGANQADSMVSSDEIQGMLDRVPGRRIVILDTCQAGAVGVRSDNFSVAKRSAARRIAFLAASQGGQSSYEHTDKSVKHGAFTHYLLEAMRELPSQNGVITLQAAFEYLKPKVADMSRSRSNAQRALQLPVLISPAVLRDTPLAVR
jgi:WD40 repeat protein